MDEPGVVKFHRRCLGIWLWDLLLVVTCCYLLFWIFKSHNNLEHFHIGAIWSRLASGAVETINGVETCPNLSRSRLAEGWNNHSLVRLKRDCINRRRKKNKAQSGMGFMSSGGCLIRSAGHSYSIKSVLSQRATKSHFSPGHIELKAKHTKTY